jgi:glycosyltransferase involved in cell wall biosynthesis
MKIAVFHELHSGGARRAVNEFSKQLRKNHLVDLYIVDDTINREENIFYSNVFFYKFIAKKWSGHNWKVRFYKDTLELYKLYKLHKQIAADINKKNYDVVLVNPSKFTQAPFILRFIKTKKIYYCMEPLRLVYDPMIKPDKNLDLIRYLYEKTIRQIRKIIDKQNVGFANGYISPSKYLADIFNKVYKKQAEVVYCGVDTKFFIPSNIKKNNDLLFVGSRNFLDGYYFFNEVLQDMGKKINYKELLSEDTWLTDVELREVYRHTKILVATSHNEPLGLVPLEAMACGCVVVAVDEGGYRETITNKTTGLLLPRNSKTFSIELNKLLNNPKLIEKFAVQGISLVNRDWNWKVCANQLEKTLDKYLS